VLDLRGVRNALRSLPSGALSVGGGLIVLGASSYGFLLIAAHTLTPTSFAALSVLYVLVYTVGPGAFLPFEQEIGRALADRRARGIGTGPLLSRAVRTGAWAIAALLVVVAAASPAITRHLFDGSWLLCAGLLLSIVGQGAAYLSRGIFAGNGQFRAYGVQMALEGGLRFLACAILAVVGMHRVGVYGLLLGAAFVVAVGVTCRAGLLRGEPGPEAPWAEFTGAVGWLITGSLLSQAVVNAGPVAVKLLAGPHQDAASGRLLAGLVLARLPLFLFAAVQAALLPRLAALLAAEQVRAFFAGLRRLVLVIVVLCGAMTAVLGAAGPELMRILFGPHLQLGRLDLVVLSGATALFMMANVLSNGLLALQRFDLAALGWAIGALALIAVLLVQASLFARVEYSFLAGSAVSGAAFLVLLPWAAGPGRRARGNARPVLDVVTGP
jgi:O-antigen/teichoic acid export membrane protein